MPTPAPGSILSLLKVEGRRVSSLPSLLAAINREDCESPRLELDQIVREYYRTHTTFQVLISLVESSALDWPELAKLYRKEVITALEQDFITYLRKRIRQGFFKPLPDLLASVDGIADGINAWNVCEAELLHNTVYFSSGVFSAMEYRFPNTTAWVANNLLSHSLEQREEAQGTVHDNIESADAGHFEDVAGGNLHLSVSSSAIDAGGSLAAGACDEDIDGDLRDADPDVGADEQVSEER